MSGPVVILEPQPDTPIVWFYIAIRGGAAADPFGREGIHRHAAILARRGAGKWDRTTLDDKLDSLGAVLDVNVSRDAVWLSGLALARNAPTVIDLVAEVLAAPKFTEDEHQHLARKSRRMLCGIREDDAALAARWFDLVCCPSHPYGRSSIGTEASIGSIADAGPFAARALWQREVVRDNLVIGLAGDFDEASAQRMVERLTAQVRQGPQIEPPSISAASPLRRRAILVDRPDRTQAQLRMGHLVARYGAPDTQAIVIAEAVLGGLFNSRLVQEIRVKRGWAYGVGCVFRRAQLPHWFQIWAVVAIAVAGPALTLIRELYAEFAAHGPTDAEVEFARRYLIGSMPFSLASARNRVQLAMRDAVFGLPVGYTSQLPVALDQLSADEVRLACSQHLQPDRAVYVAVTSAEQAEASLATAYGGAFEIHAPGSY